MTRILAGYRRLSVSADFADHADSLLLTGKRQMRARLRGGFFDPLPGQVVIGTPGLPGRQCPLTNTANVFFGIGRLVDMDDAQRSALAPGWFAGAWKVLRPVEPLLNGAIRFGRGVVFERRAHSRQMSRIGLRRPHVFRGMLKGIGIDRQPVLSRISVVFELPRHDRVEQPLTRLAASRQRRSTLRAARG